jgi:hypothetical protein
MQPTYQFRSTSAYTPTMNTTVYTPGSSTPFGAPTRPRRSDIDEEEDDPSGDPTGYIDTPIGEPLVLLLMALLYAAGRYIARRKHIIYNKQ